MPSPYRTSPNRGKRQNRYPERSPSDRAYGGQSRKKVHRDYDNDYSRDNQRQKPRYQHDSRPSIRVQKKQQIEVKVNHPPSELKVHFRFRPLKINPKNQQQLMKELKSHISSNVGPVEYFQKSFDSYPGCLIIQLGFKYDHDANLYLSGKKGKFQVKLNKQVLNISAEPSKSFQLLLSDLETKKKRTKKQSRSNSNESRQIRSKNRKKSVSSSRSKSSSSSSRSKYSRKSYERQNKGPRRYPHHQNERKWSQPRKQNQQKRQTRYQKNRNENGSNGYKVQAQLYKKQQKQQLDQNKKYKKLYFFGVHYSVNSKDMIQLLYNHQKGPFYSQQFLWRRMNGSISQYLQGKFQQQQAQKLLQIGDKMQVKGHPFIIIESQSIQNDKLLEKISQFQVNIQFPKLIQPYYLLKSLKQCGRVIQIISNNKLNEQGRSDYYNVTFNSRDVCEKLKALKTTQTGIIIESSTQDEAVFIYRPNSQTQLMTVDYVQDQKNSGKNDKNREKERQRDNKNREYD